MSEDGKKLQERTIKACQAAAPLLAATAEALQPVLAAFGQQVKRAGEAMHRWADSFTPIPVPRLTRRRAGKPCAWCAERYKRPATHVVKWREAYTWHDEFDNMPVTWPAGRKQRMCEFHAKIATRYRGVSVYRFRSLAQPEGERR